jgi:hypothetical protein
MKMKVDSMVEDFIQDGMLPAQARALAAMKRGQSPAFEDVAEIAKMVQSCLKEGINPFVVVRFDLADPMQMDLLERVASVRNQN